MKRVFGAVFALVLGVTGFSGAASAVPAGMTHTGIVTVPNATNPADFNPLVLTHIVGTAVALSLYEGEPVSYIGRLANNFSVINPFEAGLAGASLSGTGLNGKSGSWNFTFGDAIYDIVAVEINATVFVGIGHLYLTDPVANNGVWDTNDFASWLGQPNLGFMDFYGVYVGPATPADVPEPASLMLLGGGLLGLRLMRRKAR